MESLDEYQAEILLSGSGDWVSLSQAADIVRGDREVDGTVVRVETLGAVGELLRAGLVEVGDVQAGFHPWPLDAASALVEIDRRWVKPDRELGPWDGVWLANTKQGDALADQLAGDGGTTRAHP